MGGDGRRLEVDTETRVVGLELLADVGVFISSELSAKAGRRGDVGLELVPISGDELNLGRAPPDSGWIYLVGLEG